MKHRLQFAARKLVRMALLLLGVSLVAFLLMSASPLDPLQTNIGQTALGSMSAEQIERLQAYWGMDTPPAERYGNWLLGALHGDLGDSLLYRQPVLTVIGQRLASSAGLMAVAWLLSDILGVILGVVAGGAYAAERLPEHAVSSEVQAAWNARSGKIYLLVNEKYSSAFYQGTNFLAALSTAGGPEGYLANLQMAGPGTLLSCLQIPGTGSRDSYDIHMEVRDGVEYLWMNDFCYRDAGSIELLQASGAASYNIPLGGDPARWFAAAGLGGKTLTVDITGPGAFYVYDAATLQMVGSSWLYGDRSVVLPENALVLFAGGCSTLFRTEVSG